MINLWNWGMPGRTWSGKMAGLSYGLAPCPDFPKGKNAREGEYVNGYIRAFTTEPFTL